MLPLGVIAQKTGADLLSYFNKLQPRSVGPSGMSGRVTTIDGLADDANILYVGTASGGLWRSTSGGIQWEPIFDDAPHQSIGAVKVNQQNPDEIWVGTGEGNPRNSQSSGAGIYKSIDGGKNWKLMGLEATKAIHRIIIHPRNPDVVYVGAMGSSWGDNEERGVYKTTDGGKTWEKILYQNPSTGCADLVMDPQNPNKLIAAMWEFGRKPWTFNSGGEGSGMFVTFDGGETWKERTSEDGLPKGSLGRMGLAIAPSKPKTVYALIESNEPYALYKSEDGGFNWRKINDQDVGNRPFYYADIYVDPSNENRIFNLWSYVSVSEDGGKSFKTVLNYGAGVHPDHHAFWVHPKNPDFMLEGNDGGLYMSHDHGQTWRFAENLPIGQFYHIHYDMEIPYNLYGGMQDNGSWVGPAYTWSRGGLRNHHWQELLFGDGFDVVPHPENPRIGYAMYQGGNVHRYDRTTGQTRFIQPPDKGDDALRFNWNAAISADPFNNDGLYFGSQFLHYSADRGNTWRRLSPDLTTNDTAKQKQAESGGLTIDATQAENFTTILSIAPSPVDQNTIWVGTDDGRLQVTRDGGKNWTDVYRKLKGAPDGGWVPQVIASNHNADEAFVVVNHYRQNDWTPYAYITQNGGKSWKRIASEKEVSGYCLSIVQDPETPELLFLGTENGLNVSFDYGSNWTQWSHGFPAVSTMDLKIHPREQDLVIGTFGRSVYVMDDISVLRYLTTDTMTHETMHLLSIPDAYLAHYKEAAGTRFTANAMFTGANRGYGAMMSCWIGKDVRLDGPEKAVVTICQDQDTVRRYEQRVDTGFNRFYWRLRNDGIHFPSRRLREERAFAPAGHEVAPGAYTAYISYNGKVSSMPFVVHEDPRSDYSMAYYQENQLLQDTLDEYIKAVDASMQLLFKSQKAITQHVALLSAEDSVQNKMKNNGQELLDSIDALYAQVFTPKGFVGYDHVTIRLSNQLSTAKSYIDHQGGPVTQNARIAVRQASIAARAFVEQVNGFYQDEILAFKTKVEALDNSLFSDLQVIELPED